MRVCTLTRLVSGAETHSLQPRFGDATRLSAGLRRFASTEHGHRFKPLDRDNGGFGRPEQVENGGGSDPSPDPQTEPEVR